MRLRPFVHSARRLWLSDRMLLALLAILVVLVFLLPLVPLDRPERIVADLVFSLLVLSGILTLARSVAGAWLGGAVASAALAVRFLDRVVPGVRLTEWDAVLGFFAEGALAAVLLNQLFRPGSVTPFRVAGAVVVYLLLGMMWTEVYYLIEILRPGAFHFMSPPPANEMRGRLHYFSYATLSTVGYGDVTALHPVARSAANLEALTGQLFPAILIARLVAMGLTAGSRDGKRRAAAATESERTDPYPGRASDAD